MKDKLKALVNKCDLFVVLMLSVGIVLRCIYLLEYSKSVNFDIACGADVREYFDRMSEMISGRFFPEKPDIHGIFYPLFSAPFLRLSGSVVFIRIIQNILNYLAFCALYVLLGKYHVSLAVRRIFLALSMLYTVLFFHVSELISESLLIPLVTAQLFMLYRARSDAEHRNLFSGAAGVFAGLTILTHGAMLLYFLFTVVRLYLEKQKKCAAIMLSTALLVTGVFCAVKSHTYSKFCFVQDNGGFNFYLGNSKDADGTCNIRPGLKWRNLHAAAEKEAQKRGVSKDTVFLGRALHYIFTEPAAEAWLLLRKAVKFFHFHELISGADPPGLLYRTHSIRIGSLLTLFVMVVSLAGFVAAWKRKKDEIPVDFMLLYLAVFAVNLLTVTSGRYRVAAYPSIFLYSAYAIALLPPAVPVILAVVSAFTTVIFPPDLKDFESERILGEAAFRKRNYDLAYMHLTKIRANNSDPSGVENMLGAVYEQLKMPGEAKKCYSRAMEYEPERYEAYMNAARLEKNPHAAEQLYGKALVLAPESALLNVNYAKHLINTRRAPKAVEYARKAVDSQSGNHDAWNTLAVAYAFSGRMKLALEAFESASRLEPQNVNYRRNAESIRLMLIQRSRHRRR